MIDAGRPRPRVIAAGPVLITDNKDAGRAVAAETLAFCTTIPSYQNVIAREGVAQAPDRFVEGVVTFTESEAHQMIPRSEMR